MNCLASARATLPLSPLTNLPSVTKFGLNLRIFRLCIFWCVFFQIPVSRLFFEIVFSGRCNFASVSTVQRSQRDQIWAQPAMNELQFASCPEFEIQANKILQILLFLISV